MTPDYTHSAVVGHELRSILKCLKPYTAKSSVYVIENEKTLF